MEEDYSKRELDSHFEELGNKIDENTKITSELSTKVGIQNGRVAKNEATIKGAMMAGTVAVFLLGIIMSLIVYSFKISQDNLRATILLSVQQMIK